MSAAVRVVPADCSHPGDAEVWNNSKLWDPSLFTEEGAEIIFTAGAYQGHQRIVLGDHVTVRGEARIDPPADRMAPVTIDPTKMAVLWADHKGATEKKKDNSDTTGLRLSGTGTIVRDLFLQGYTGADLLGSTDTLFERVGVCHYFGAWPEGRWAWFQQTGGFFLHGGTTGATFRDCFAQCTQHHGYLLHDGGWIKKTRFERCRALVSGCGLEPDGSGYGDWSVAFDLAEQVDVDQVDAVDCTATYGGKVGFYCEPESTGSIDRGSPYVRRGVRLKGCLAAYNGRYGGGTLGEMRIREGEQSNYYGGGWTAEDCLSIAGAKAGFYNRLEFNVDPLIYRRCVDIRSNIGFLLELAGAAGTYQDCYAFEPVRMGFKLMGSGPVILEDDCKVQIAAGSNAEPFHLGGYTRVYLQDSRDAGHKALVARTSAETHWGMPKLSIAARVAGTDRDLVFVHPRTSVNLSAVKVERAASLPVPAGLAYLVPGGGPTDPPVVVDPVVPPIVLPPEVPVGSLVRINQGAILLEVPAKSRSKYIGQVPDDLVQDFLDGEYRRGA